jgi:hypothetical protein
MIPDLPQPPGPCAAAQAALEADPLSLPPAVAAHLRACPACSEARILWLAMAEVEPVEAPAGYFEGLGFRILRKLPARPVALKRRAALWLTAAALIGALGVGLTGFFAGRAVRAPLVEAAQPRSLAEPQAETPFAEPDSEDALSELSTLTPEEAEAALQRLQAPNTAQPAHADAP